MTYIRSRKHSAHAYLAALATLATSAALIPAAVHAGIGTETGADTSPDQTTTEVVVKGQATGYKADKDSSSKHPEALVNTPQTITIINKEVLQDQAATSLTDALRNTPGITIQLGENGSTSAGDTFQMRGFAAQSSIFLDGIQDLGAVTRDIYNIEQVEVAKGPAGSDAGRGASAGYINLVSKLPVLGGGSSATGLVYSQGGARGTADSDVQTGKTSAFRLNLMDQDIDVAGRDDVKNRGYGIAPSYAIGLGTDTRAYLYAQYQNEDNLPDGGIPVIGYKGYYNANLFLDHGAKVDTDNFYGSPSDYEKVAATMLTGKIEHDLADGFTINNITRYGETTMNRVITGVNGLTATSADPSTWTVTRMRQRTDQENDILADQANLTGSFKTGAWQHDLTAGLEFDYQHQSTASFSTTGLTVTPANLYHPNPNDVMAVPVATGATSDGTITTASVYLFDTAKYGEHWLINGGARIDDYSVRTNTISVSTATSNPTLPVGTLVPANLKKSGNILSWNVGVVYKPAENGSVYISYADAMTPPGSANLTLSATATNISNSAFKPSETDNLEVGTKWNLLKDKLALTAAYYLTDAKNQLTQVDPITNLPEQLGDDQVTGIELSAVGQITPQWQLSAGLETMHTEIKQGTTGNSTAGAATRWSPDLTATFWTTYKVTPKFTIGGGANYIGVQKFLVNPGTNPATSPGIPQIPAYWVASAMANYDLTKRLALQLNVNNLFNEKYIGTLNNGSSRIIPGVPLSGVLSLNVKF